jgi:hypothetical protein
LKAPVPYLEAVGGDCIPPSTAVNGIEQLVHAPQLQDVVCLCVVHVLEARKVSRPFVSEFVDEEKQRLARQKVDAPGLSKGGGSVEQSLHVDRLEDGQAHRQHRLQVLFCAHRDDDAGESSVDGPKRCLEEEQPHLNVKTHVHFSLQPRIDAGCAVAERNNGHSQLCAALVAREG